MLAGKLDLQEGRTLFEQTAARLAAMDDSSERVKADLEIVIEFINKLQAQLGGY